MHAHGKAVEKGVRACMRGYRRRLRVIMGRGCSVSSDKGEAGGGKCVLPLVHLGQPVRTGSVYATATHCRSRMSFLFFRLTWTDSPCFHLFVFRTAGVGCEAGIPPRLQMEEVGTFTEPLCI